MRLAHALALVASFTLFAPTADARPRKARKHRVVVDERPDDASLGRADDARVARLAARQARRQARLEAAREAREDDGEPAREDADDAATREDDVATREDAGAIREDDEDAEVDLAPVKLREHARSKLRDWHLALGPYLWASAVEADVSLGSQSVSAGVDFMDVTRHARYGIELLGEARYKRFSVAADVMYGVVDLEGAGDVGPVMVSVAGTAASLLLDGTAGVTVLGDDHSLLAVEARAGVRYQRTSITASVGVANSPVASPSHVDAAGDALAGTRVFVRPFSRLAIAGAFDMRAFGVSKNTWSASADANVRVSNRVLLSLGWRTLTMERASMTMRMYGPRVAVQLLF